MKKILLLIGWMSGLQGVSGSVLEGNDVFSNRLLSDEDFLRKGLSNEKSLNKSVLSEESLNRGPSSEGAREERGEGLRPIKKEALWMDLSLVGEFLKRAVDNLQEVKCFFSNPSLMPELPALLSDVCARMEAPMKLEKDFTANLTSVFSQLQFQISKAEEILDVKKNDLRKEIILLNQKIPSDQTVNALEVVQRAEHIVKFKALNAQLKNLSQVKTMLSESRIDLNNGFGIFAIEEFKSTRNEILFKSRIDLSKGVRTQIVEGSKKMEFF